jgi:hypothetical protein
MLLYLHQTSFRVLCTCIPPLITGRILKMVIEWKLCGPLLEIEWILVIHNNCICPYYGYSIEIVRIYYGYSVAIANFIVWISLFFPVHYLDIYLTILNAFKSERFQLYLLGHLIRTILTRIILVLYGGLSLP